MYAADLATLAAELSAPTVGRLADLDRCARRQAACPTCAQITELVDTTILCVRYREPDTAERLVNDAIVALDDPAHQHCPTASAPPGQQPQRRPVADFISRVPVHPRLRAGLAGDRTLLGRSPVRTPSRRQCRLC